MNRSDYVGSSDAKRILDGDWLALYQEKIGERPPEDLNHNFPVQLGVHTEKFHLAWLNWHCGFDIVPQPALMRMPGHQSIGAHLDGFDRVRNTFVEVKHSNARASRDSMVDWYQPQMAHMCNVEEKDGGVLSFIAGNEAPQWFMMEPSKEYRDALLEMELAFWWHVANREPPNVLMMEPKLEQLKKAAKDVRLDGMRAVSMELNNQWAVHATDYLLNKGAAEVFERAKKDLKAMVEPDVREASGMGICIKRSKSGSLLISEV
jgi:hypothetical protein